MLAFSPIQSHFVALSLFLIDALSFSVAFKVQYVKTLTVQLTHTHTWSRHSNDAILNTPIPCLCVTYSHMRAAY